MIISKGGINVKRKYHPPEAKVVLISADDVILVSGIRLTDVSLGVLDIDAVEIYK